MALSGLLALALGLVLAQFLVLLYEHWFFANAALVKTLLLAVPLTLLYLLALLSPLRRLALQLAAYWLAIFAFAAIGARSLDLRQLSFVNVLNYEAAFVWLPVLWLTGYAALSTLRRQRAAERERRVTARQLRLRRRLREDYAVAVAGSAPATVDATDEPLI